MIEEFIKNATVHHEDGTRMVSPLFTILLFTNHDFTSIPDEVLYVYDAFLNLCGKDTFKFYENENMTRPRLVKKETFNLLPGWLKNAGKNRREMIHIRLADGDNYAATPDHAMLISGVEDGTSGYGYDANVIKLSLPIDYFLKNSVAIEDFVLDLLCKFPVSSATAGYSLDISQFHTAVADSHAWRISMEYQGLDIFREAQDVDGVGKDGIKGVNWLTAVSADLIQHAPEFPGALMGNDAIKIDTLASGVIVARAGDLPTFGEDKHQLDLYRQVFSAVAPLMQPTLSRFGAFSLPGGDHIAKTDEWLMRLQR